MSFWRLFRALLLAVASLGYLANGAQAHLHISQGETLDLMMCGTSANRTVSLEIPGHPIEETEDTCCGDCMPAFGILPPNKTAVSTALFFAQPVPAHLPDALSPRSPLWPGAPPQGPPFFLKARPST